MGIFRNTSEKTAIDHAARKRAAFFMQKPQGIPAAHWISTASVKYFVEDIADLRILVDLINLIMGKADEFMAGVMDPP